MSFSKIYFHEKVIDGSVVELLHLERASRACPNAVPEVWELLATDARKQQYAAQWEEYLASKTPVVEPEEAPIVEEVSVLEDVVTE